MTAPLFAGIGGHHGARSRTDEWLTPPSLITALGGPTSFDLDPCSPIDRPWPTAREHFSIVDDGLSREWFGRVWLNPPYSTSVIGKWLDRLARHDHGIALIFARTETDAFFRFVWERASAVLFVRGRINFHHVDGRQARKNSGAPSVLCAFGSDDAEILSASGVVGQFVPLRLPRSVVITVFEPRWTDLIGDWLRQQGGSVALADLYRAFASHPKARANRHVDAKIRQVLQAGPFRRTSRGRWEAI